ncbi:MAG: Holliday junction branch migration protein RuvA [Rubrobacter sp.]|nr:Holliday junction branch migration protein RuvA [Rubrobacter sp.]
MIERLRGQLVEKDAEGVVVDVGGVGYRALAPASTIRVLPAVGEECGVYTRMVVREDAMLLFGFASRDERAAFDALVSVSKIGPKLAVAALSTLSPPEISEAVGRNDVLKLATVPGLGKKTAERVVLELRGTDLAAFGFGSLVETVESAGGSGNGSAPAGPFMEAREALTGLGYSLEEAEAALREVPRDEGVTVEGYVREALRRIGSRR